MPLLRARREFEFGLGKQNVNVGFHRYGNEFLRFVAHVDGGNLYLGFPFSDGGYHAAFRNGGDGFVVRGVAYPALHAFARERKRRAQILRAPDGEFHVEGRNGQNGRFAHFQNGYVAGRQGLARRGRNDGFARPARAERSARYHDDGLVRTRPRYVGGVRPRNGKNGFLKSAEAYRAAVEFELRFRTADEPHAEERGKRGAKKRQNFFLHKILPYFIRYSNCSKARKGCPAPRSWLFPVFLRRL